MKHVIAAIALIGTSCATTTTTTIPIDAERNYELNTTEILADGKRWNLILPPNYKIMRHVVKDDIEILSVRSKFSVGDRYINVDVVAQSWDADSSQDSLCAGAHESIVGLDGWKQVYGPATVTLDDKTGCLDMGMINDDAVLVQLSFVDKNNGYILRCSGDANAKIRVVNKCQELLERFHAKEDGGQPSH